MWWVACALLGVLTVLAAGDQLHHGSFDRQDLDDSNADEASSPPPNFLDPVFLTKLRRYGQGGRMHNPQEIDDVQGAIKELLSGRYLDFGSGNGVSKYNLEHTKRIEVTRSKFFDIAMIFNDTQTSAELMPTSSAIAKPPAMGEDWFRRKGILRDDKASTTTIDSNTTSTGSTTTTETEEPTTTTTVPTTTSEKFDIDALLAIVANLTYDYDTNLTQELNETLQRYSIPTCPTPTTTTTTTPSPTSTELVFKTTVVAKCFVCGMDTPGIPHDAYCADAFATDFLPLLPVDARAKGHIARFRKYCRYFDIKNFQHNRSDPRAFLGRWTGGCAVRWIDLSGIYTQRTCRNRQRPATGRHFGSKRMAKLERTLSDLDDGCIISPMATLVPLSRGVSLYARFHACVCSGNWCNRAVVVQQWTAFLWLLLLAVVEVVR